MNLNLNKIGQYIATSASAALLATFATLATSSASLASSLIKIGEVWEQNGTGAVTEIKNLQIGDDYFDVEFVPWVTINEIESDRELFILGQNAEAAFDAISGALGTQYYTHKIVIPPNTADAQLETGGTQQLETGGTQSQSRAADTPPPAPPAPRVYEFDIFNVVESLDESFINLRAEERSGLNHLAGEDAGSIAYRVKNFGEQQRLGLVAKMELSRPAGGEEVSTPEPSLIFGFITLGGLMLGSKRKTKG